MFVPCCLCFVSRQMRHGRRQPRSPPATRSRLSCRRPWSPRPRYGDRSLPPPRELGWRAGRSSRGPLEACGSRRRRAFSGMGCGGLQVAFRTDICTCLVKRLSIREYIDVILLGPFSLSLWWQSSPCLVACLLCLPPASTEVYPAKAFSLVLVTGQARSVPGV